jgi:hypothetical protein
MEKIAILIRGHEREVTKNTEFSDFIFELSQNFDLDIFIHTWNKNEAESSWRILQSPTYEIKEELIMSYFDRNLKNIKDLTIEDDSEIQINGEIHGNLGEKLTNFLPAPVKRYYASRCPVIAWKKMWYGIFHAVNKAQKSKIRYKAVVNTRFDIFNVYQNNDVKEEQFQANNLLNFTKSYKNQNILFTSNTNCLGIDNFYMGKKDYIFELCENFHYRLDDIIMENKMVEWLPHQEKLVFLEAQKLYGKYLNGKSKIII